MSILNPTPEEQEEDRKLIEMMAEDERWHEKHAYGKTAWAIGAAVVLYGVIRVLT